MYTWHLRLLRAGWTLGQPLATTVHQILAACEIDGGELLRAIVYETVHGLRPLLLDDELLEAGLGRQCDLPLRTETAIAVFVALLATRGAPQWLLPGTGLGRRLRPALPRDRELRRVIEGCRTPAPALLASLRNIEVDEQTACGRAERRLLDLVADGGLPAIYSVTMRATAESLFLGARRGRRIRQAFTCDVVHPLMSMFERNRPILVGCDQRSALHHARVQVFLSDRWASSAAEWVDAPPLETMLRRLGDVFELRRG